MKVEDGAEMKGEEIEKRARESSRYPDMATMMTIESD